MSAVAEPTYATLAAENSRLKAENERLRAELAACRKHAKMQAAYMTWEDDLLENTRISATEKIIAIQAREEYRRQACKDHEPEPTGAPGEPEPAPKLVYLDVLARRAGVSKSTAGDALKRLQLAGAIRKIPMPGKDAGGQPIMRLAIAPTSALLIAPKTLAPPADAPRHGDPKRFTLCPNPQCRSANIVERTQVICRDCGEILSSHEKPVNTPEPDEQVQQTQETTPRRHLAFDISSQREVMDEQPVIEEPEEPQEEPQPVYVLPVTHFGEEPPHEPCGNCGKRVPARRRGWPDAWVCRVCWPELTL